MARGAIEGVFETLSDEAEMDGSTTSLESNLEPFMRVDLSELNVKAKSLEGTQLSQFAHDPKEKSLRLTFEHWNGSTLVVKRMGVIHCAVSADGLDGDSEVIGASVREVPRNALEYFDKFGYLWNLSVSEGRPLEGDWLHISLDGDTCAAILCKEIAFSA